LIKYPLRGRRVDTATPVRS